jgi:hypothetical protein
MLSALIPGMPRSSPTGESNALASRIIELNDG